MSPCGDILRTGRDSNPRPPPWQGGILTNWTTDPFSFRDGKDRVFSILSKFSTKTTGTFSLISAFHHVFCILGNQLGFLPFTKFFLPISWIGEMSWITAHAGKGQIREKCRHENCYVWVAEQLVRYDKRNTAMQKLENGEYLSGYTFETRFDGLIISQNVYKEN